jgi:hypothetical protein
MKADSRAPLGVPGVELCDALCKFVEWMRYQLLFPSALVVYISGCRHYGSYG